MTCSSFFFFSILNSHLVRDSYNIGSNIVFISHMAIINFCCIIITYSILTIVCMHHSQTLRLCDKLDTLC